MDLSARQQKAATKAAAKPMEGLATVSRPGGTETATGRSNTPVLVYDQIPVAISPGTSSNPGTTEYLQHAVSDLESYGYCWFPTEWADETESGDILPVSIHAGDIIVINGETWYATTDEDPRVGFQTRVRARVNRPHDQVSA